MRIKKSILPLFVAVLCFWSADLFAQVGYNNPNPHPSSIVDMQSNDKGLLIPRMTSSERSAMAVSSTTPAEGLLVFDTDVNRIFYWDDDVTAWRAVNFADVTQIGNDEFVTMDASLVVNNNIQLNGTLNADSISMNQNSGPGVVPQGGIIMWKGSTNNIPQGYALCDGTNGTPDLRGRFVVGAGGGYAVNDTGGSNDVTLNSTQTPLKNHNHSVSLTTGTNGDHNHQTGISVNASSGAETASYAGQGLGSSSNASNCATGTGNCNAVAVKNYALTDNKGNHSHSVSGNTNSTSDSNAQPHENRPPYFALAYIMKL
ncbi:hypothetical protein [Salibacter halophilus]|uniref:Tail fiber protein n=1 Tax=Salibacter halophilus TaxID=1803916 RepID=A0A6N6MAQ0_9FLAO|nr:hypothetical protein [Salibacter halophilus]KAB1065517.1 hypothetical protein F3059_02365 [Salibacter halophilus]